MYIDLGGYVMQYAVSEIHVYMYFKAFFANKCNMYHANNAKRFFSGKKLDSHCQTRISTEGRDR